MSTLEHICKRSIRVDSRAETTHRLATWSLADLDSQINSLRSRCMVKRCPNRTPWRGPTCRHPTAKGLMLALLTWLPRPTSARTFTQASLQGTEKINSAPKSSSLRSATTTLSSVAGKCTSPKAWLISSLSSEPSSTKRRELPDSLTVAGTKLYTIRK